MNLPLEKRKEEELPSESIVIICYHSKLFSYQNGRLYLLIMSNLPEQGNCRKQNTANDNRPVGDK